MSNTTTAPVSEFHEINTLKLSPRAVAELNEVTRNASPGDRRSTQLAFLEDLLTDAAAIGEALSRAKGHLICPACFQAFPKTVDVVALEAKLREVHSHIANAAQALSEAAVIATNG